jgi:squalene-hopene/tetraprenyl-beta-curcumene cyclase
MFAALKARKKRGQEHQQNTVAAASALSATPATEQSTLLAHDVHDAMRRTQHWLLRRQETEGYWCAELEGDTILESEFILLWAFLGRREDPLCARLAKHMLAQQLPSGGWAIYPNGPLEMSASVKAYFALKLVGHDPESEPLRRARTAILAAGGADQVNSFTRFYLALLGQISYECCPEVPPEFVLLPKWSPINMWGVSAWSRPMIVTLSIMSAKQPVTLVPDELGIKELFIDAPESWSYNRCPGLRPSVTGWMWEQFFKVADRGLKIARRLHCLPLRKRALNKARDWMIAHFERSDGLAAIFPPMVWSIIALKALGYKEDQPELKYAIERLLALVIEDGDSARVQPCKSPVWDTAISLRSLCESGIEADEPRLVDASRWLIEREVRLRGDWSATVNATPGGWAFEFDNDFYPDLDDTAMVLMALAHQYDEPPAASDGVRQRSSAPAELLADINGAMQRGETWMRAMQNRDGGWGAFDRDNNREFLCRVPFADHNAMLDPSTPDLTARVMEAFARLGRSVGDTTIDRAVRYMRRSQEEDGSWFGRWGVNYIYGTWQALQGLAAAGVPNDDPMLYAGCEWLIRHQQANGGWGESPATYDHPETRGQGTTTASQTAWALLGLISAGHANHSAVHRGIEYLVARQRVDGGWDEPEWTGTGFPRVFYLRYHYYPIYFPLMALARYAKATKE